MWFLEAMVLESEAVEVGERVPDGLDGAEAAGAHLSLSTASSHPCPFPVCISTKANSGRVSLGRSGTGWTTLQRSGGGGDQRMIVEPGHRRGPRALKGPLSLDPRPASNFYIASSQILHPTSTFQNCQQSRPQERERQDEPCGGSGAALCRQRWDRGGQ